MLAVGNASEGGLQDLPGPGMVDLEFFVLVEGHVAFNMSGLRRECVFYFHQEYTLVWHVKMTGHHCYRIGNKLRLRCTRRPGCHGE